MQAAAHVVAIDYFSLRQVTPIHSLPFLKKGERRPQVAARLSDHQLWTVFVRDPDQNLIGLMEEVR